MSTIILFYSYSHKDEKLREVLEKNLTLLKNNELIKDWHDRKIGAGEDWNETIDDNMRKADIILLLISPDFINSASCMNELRESLNLENEQGTKVIPIILKPCAWMDISEISRKLVLPKDGKPITKWQNKDDAWLYVYEAIKAEAKKIQENIEPKVRTAFREYLLKGAVSGYRLDRIYVYPDLSEVDVDTSNNLENNKKFDAIVLQNLRNFEWKYILLQGEEQSGKTSLCKMLFLHYVDNGFYPILLTGKDIVGKADLKNIINNKYKDQYETGKDYWSLDKEKRFLLIDDIDEKLSNEEYFSKFLLSIKNCFEYAVLFIDELQNLSERSAEPNQFSYFHCFAINPFGHKKRNELIKKCISNEEEINFDDHKNEHLARLDRDTKHINTIIGSNIVPSYPIFIITIFQTIEVLGSKDLSNTSYGHCYHAMLTMNLGRVGIKAQDIDSYFNLLTQLAYFMFEKNSKSLTTDELKEFLKIYKEKFVSTSSPESSLEKLREANIIISKSNEVYLFQYIYIYYYFVARYISRKMHDDIIKKKIDDLIKDIHLKDNANIIVFITHHTENKYVLEQILNSTIDIFKNFSIVTLSDDEKSFVESLSNHILLDSNHISERQKELDEKDKLPADDKQTDYDSRDKEAADDSNLIEIKKSAKCMEIIGQILRNQYGSLERDQLTQLFKEGRDVGLRLLKWFMEFMVAHENEIETLIQFKLDQLAQKNSKVLSTEEKKRKCRKIIDSFSYSILFGWLHKIVDSIGYDKLVEVSDEVNNKTNTVASKLINLSIHTWYKKNLDIEKIICLFEELDDKKNNQAVYILKDIVARHIYMHPIDYKDKQKINHYLGFSLKTQRIIQQELTKK